MIIKFNNDSTHTLYVDSLSFTTMFSNSLTGAVRNDNMSLSLNREHYAASVSTLLLFENISITTMTLDDNDVLSFPDGVYLNNLNVYFGENASYNGNVLLTNAPGIVEEPTPE